MAITTDRREHYADDPRPCDGAEQDERAQRHRARALAALEDGEHAADALVHALLALEARVEELTVYVARLG